MISQIITITPVFGKREMAKEGGAREQIKGAKQGASATPAEFGPVF
jgi:hypothetical protein